MAALLALVATILTSFLPILNKCLLRDSRPALVAWIINTASLPILEAGTLLLTQCSMTPLRGSLSLACAAHIPRIDGLFVAALLTSALLNWAATLLSTLALARADASLVSPLLTFNPAFTLLLAWPALGEAPGLHQPGTLLAIAASALWGTTTVLEKLAIDHMTPPSGPAVALIGTFLLVALLTPGALRSTRAEEPSLATGPWQGLRSHPRALAAAVLLAGVAPLFGFTAIALGVVGYVTTLFKLSAVLTIVWARVFLHEGQMRERLLGASVMVVGGMLVAA